MSEVAEVDETLAEEARAGKPLAAGAQLGRFTLRRVLGEGGMGVVWAAHDPDLDREIAIKVLRHQTAASPALRKRLLREARAMARLKHPNVITVYEVGSTGDTDFIAMELVEGTTMDDWLSHAPPADDVWRALIAAGRGLAAAHAAGLVHRDFKPHNVLRSRDGRVLVTDFGLARGLGDDTAEQQVEVVVPTSVALDETIDATKSTPTPSRTDSVLDSPLTQTGAMIGTPAYMAPEQFHGAPPDPRTDQFAYCITAWQALTGARPFHGDTLEELRRAAAGGVDAVVADLPKPVRTVLARGLDPDPAKRWPELGTLIDALEETRRPPMKRWPFVLAGAVLVAALIFVVARAKDESRRAQIECAPAEQVFEPARELGEPTARAFEQFRGKWIKSYQGACNAPASKHRDARLACLRGVRDEAAAIRLVLAKAAKVDAYAILPNLAVCDGPTPIAPPEAPTDPARRTKTLELLARAVTLRGLPDTELPAAVDELLTDGASVGWKPLEPMLQTLAANAYLRHGETTRARKLLRAALPAADMRFQAIAHLGLLEASIYELEKPNAPAKPGLHDELARQFTYARSAVRSAGNDPILAGAVAILEAQAKTALAHWSRARQPYSEPLELAVEARKHFERAGDLRRVAQVASLEARIHLWRGHEGALADAEFVARSADEALRAAGLPSVRAIDEVRAQIAFARADYRDAHQRYDALYAPQYEESGVRKGRVVDNQGNGKQATVVAWKGELHGDPMRVYTRPQLTGAVIETAADGTFEYSTGDALIAEAGGLRSAPRPAGDDVTLVLETTTSTNAGIERRLVLVDAFARYRVGAAEWFVHAPIGKDGNIRIDGLPAGSFALGLRGPAGDGERRVVDRPGKLRWPQGSAIEVILRSDRDLRDEAARAWIFRGKVAPKTRREIEALAASAADVAHAPLVPVGAAATDAGREVYAAGDRHAVITGNAAGDVTVCIALVDEPIGNAYCAPLAVDDNRGVSPVLFETAPVLHPAP